jgi:5-methyltetrahydrofolate--homocysteine methyltransferase
MIIIGEKINGTRKRVARAIAERDGEFIRGLAISQAEAGADWLDVNAGTQPAQEPADLFWLIENIQAAVDTPLCLDSANPVALSAAIEAVDKTPLINSISGEPARLQNILPLAAKFECPVIALAMNDQRIPETSEARMNVLREVMRAVAAHQVPADRVYLDPLGMTVATNTNSGVVTLETIAAIRREYPDAHITMGLSNLSFGLPARSHISRSFLTLAIQAGLDSVIIDPTDRGLIAAIRSTELVLGRDRHCLNYIRAYRAGLFGERDQPAKRAG